MRKMVIPGGSPSTKKVVNNFWEASKQSVGRKDLGGAGYEKRTKQMQEPDRDQESKRVKGAKRVMENK